MLRSLFLYVRQKPKAVRNLIALAISSVFTGLVALVWIMGQVDRPETQQIVENSVSSPEYEMPFSGLFDQLKQQLASVKESISTTTATSSPDQVAGDKEDASVTSMTLSPETIASSSQLLPVLGTTTSTNASSSVATTTSTSTTTVTQPVPTEPYRAIQIATTSRPVATTTPPL